MLRILADSQQLITLSVLQVKALGSRKNWDHCGEPSGIRGYHDGGGRTGSSHNASSSVGQE